MTIGTCQRQPEVSRQTVVVIGGSAGIVLERARRARAEGIGVILTGTDRPCDGRGRRSCLPLSGGGLL